MIVKWLFSFENRVHDDESEYRETNSQIKRCGEDRPLRINVCRASNNKKQIPAHRQPENDQSHHDERPLLSTIGCYFRHNKNQDESHPEHDTRYSQRHLRRHWRRHQILAPFRWLALSTRRKLLLGIV